MIAPMKDSRRRGRPPILPEPLDTGWLGVTEVGEKLGKSKQWVRDLANRDPREYPNHLPKYVKNPHGPGFIRKIGPSHNKEPFFFRDEDIEAYKKNHPEQPEPDLSDVVIAPALRDLIIKYGQEQLQSKNYVVRRDIKRRLMEEHGYSDRVQRAVQAVAQQEKWRFPPRGNLSAKNGRGTRKIRL